MACIVIVASLAISRAPRELILQATVETDPIHVGSRIGGRVRSVHVEEGSAVQPGQLLVQFDDAEMLAAKAAAQSAIGRQNELLPTMGLFLQAAWRQTIEAEYVKALAQFEAVEKAPDGTPAALASAREKLDQAARVRERALKQSASTFAAAGPATQIHVLDLQIGELAVRAPDQAVVETLAVRPGDLVPPGRPVAVLIEPTRAYVLAYVTADTAVQLRVGSPVKIRTVRPAAEYDAIVRQVALAPEYSPRMGVGEPEDAESRFAVKFRPVAGLSARPGSRVQVTIPAAPTPK